MVTCFSIAHGAALANGKKPLRLSVAKATAAFDLCVYLRSSALPVCRLFPVKTLSLVGKGLVTVFLPRVRIYV